MMRGSENWAELSMEWKEKVWSFNVKRVVGILRKFRSRPNNFDFISTLKFNFLPVVTSLTDAPHSCRSNNLFNFNSNRRNAANVAKILTCFVSWNIFCWLLKTSFEFLNFGPARSYLVSLSWLLFRQHVSSGNFTQPFKFSNKKTFSPSGLRLNLLFAFFARLAKENQNWDRIGWDWVKGQKMLGRSNRCRVSMLDECARLDEFESTWRSFNALFCLDSNFVSMSHRQPEQNFHFNLVT